MKTKLLVNLVGGFLFLMAGLISCEKCGPFAGKFKVVGLDFSTQNAEYSETAERKLTLSLVEKNDTISYNLFSILINPEIEGIFSLHQKMPKFDLVSTAYACSPPIPTTDERIDSILITTNKYFDEQHPAGTNLSGLFDVVVFDEVNNIFYERFKLKDYVSTKPSVPGLLVLVLNNPPAKSEAFEFTVEYYQDGVDFDFFEFKTQEVFIQKD